MASVTQSPRLPSAVAPDSAAPPARLLWLLPVWAALLAGSTVTHQPDFRSDFPAYADYITTTQFVASHIGASIGGAALATIGAVSLLLVLERSSGARLARQGTAAFVAGQAVLSAMFGVAAFAQPAIGEAFHDGDIAAAEEMNSRIYEQPLIFVLAVIGTTLLAFGVVRLAHAGERAGLIDRTWRVALVVGVIGFAVVGIAISPVQPWAALVLTVALVRLVRGARAVTPAPHVS